ncbi:MAG: helix-turn-helix transcriptional regulator [Chloroflexaceae bacterium]|nr:helix-turn-helix transcriptional regulator [Chloroflexaceae bacterium]
MSLFSLLQEAEMHRTAYQAFLQGVLKRSWSKRQFAQRVDISVQYLSYILHDERVLSITLAERMASVLALSADERYQFLFHVHGATEKRLRLQQEFSLSGSDKRLDASLQRLRELHNTASFTHHVEASKTLFRTVYTIGCGLLQQVHHTDPLLDVVELYLLLHDTASVLYMQINALYYAKSARFLIDLSNRWEFPVEKRDRYDQMEINALRAEAVAYHNLGLDREALHCCQAIEMTTAIQKQPALWIPHLYRDTINALSGRPRFAIREAEAYADTVRMWCDRLTDTSAPLMVCMIERSLAHAYLQYGNLRKAQRLLQYPEDLLSQLPVVGPLHRVLVLGTAAQIRWHIGDTTEWSALIQAALTTALAAGLTHQIESMKNMNQSQKWYNLLPG